MKTFHRMYMIKHIKYGKKNAQSSELQAFCIYVDQSLLTQQLLRNQF